MLSPIENYRKGYEKGKSDGFGDVTAEALLGYMREDPGGHFGLGYKHGRSGEDFNPPLTPKRNPKSVTRLVPKFSADPIGWFFGVMIATECWVLWQLIKAPFQLIGALAGGQKPALSIIFKNGVIVAIIVAFWFGTHR